MPGTAGVPVLPVPASSREVAGTGLPRRSFRPCPVEGRTGPAEVAGLLPTLGAPGKESGSVL